ncbi:hypothetical protein niasHT_030583 [Heterodera trifolii]|uniref:Uncharacterized protein n=1 Tax=Heterodera trifolii TaxID=157864 RepID=A0ABD2IRC4_9BILA
MSFNDFECKIVTKPIDDICNELNGVNKLKSRHELLCQTLASWKLGMEQNNSQLNILNETAQILNARHKSVVEMLASKSADPAMLTRLQREIHAMELQVDIWLREISDVSNEREKLQMQHAFEFSHQNQHLQRNAANFELAKMDADFLCRKHCKMWHEFLTNEQEQKEGNEEQ